MTFGPGVAILAHGPEAVADRSMRKPLSSDELSIQVMPSQRPYAGAAWTPDTAAGTGAAGVVAQAALENAE